MNDTTGKLKKILNSTQLDDKTFTGILLSTDILLKRKMEVKKNPDYNAKYMKFKRFLNPPQTKEKESDQNYLIKKYSRQFINRTIDSSTFKDLLTSKGINSNAEAINKYIRATESGKNVKLSELLFSIMTFGNQKFDPTTVTYDKGSNAFRETTEGALDKSMVPTGKGESQMAYIPKKRRPDPKLNLQNSTNEIFDWDANTLKELEAKAETDYLSKPNPTATQKNLYDSHVFDKSPSNSNDQTHMKKKSEATAFRGAGDLLTWKNLQDGECDSPGKNVKRKNPNETKIETNEERKPVKLNKMLAVSEENTLNRKK